MTEIVIFGDEAWLREDFDALPHGEAATYTALGCRCDECREARNRSRPSQTRQTPTETADQPYSDPLWDRYR